MPCPSFAGYNGPQKKSPFSSLRDGLSLHIHVFFGLYYYTPLIVPGIVPSLCKNCVLGAIKGVYIHCRVTLIQHTTPLKAPGAIPSLCKNRVLGAIKGV